MNSNNQDITQLLEKLANKNASREDVNQLYSLLRKDNNDEVVVSSVESQLASFEPEDMEDIAFWKNQFADTPAKLTANLNTEHSVFPAGSFDEASSITPVPTAHRVHFLKTSWFRYAAAVLLIAGTATFLYKTYSKPQQEIANNQSLLQTDIQPGGNKAILTLADGSTIVLDNASEGQLANQGNFQIIKLADGQLAYKAQGASNLPADPAHATDAYNTLSTPKGGQYRLVLPDGSKVWLNAASSITYPVAFNGVKRNVTVTGEAYFEIEKDPIRPFSVSIGSNEVEVLGTSFNIMGYQDEPALVTTLLQGAVKFKNETKDVLLKPGQQAIVFSDDQKKISVQEGVITEDAVAWKNGLFSLERASIEQVMRQIARWYDVEVIYESHFKGHLTGEIPRSMNLEEVMQVLHLSGVNFRIKGKKVIISS